MSRFVVIRFNYKSLLLHCNTLPLCFLKPLKSNVMADDKDPFDFTGSFGDFRFSLL